MTRLLSSIFISSIFLSLLGGCAAFNYTASDAPKALATLSPLHPQPRIAVVLGSGGPRGYAHLGVIKVLEANGIKPDLIVGTSVGALIGSFWASGLDAATLESRSDAGGPLTLFDINPFADRGWIRGRKLQDYVNTELSQVPLDKLKTSMIVVATNRQTKQATYFNSGNTGVAVRASSAVPTVISPVGILSTEYEDGDVSLPLAVSAAREAGAQFIIAVDVSAHESATPKDAPENWKAFDALRRARVAPEAAKADFLIHPDLGYTASPLRSYFQKAKLIGEQTASSQMAELLLALRAKGLK